MDFVVEEDLKAHLTCWYIQKYIKENPHPHYLEHILHWEPEMGKISILIGWFGIGYLLGFPNLSDWSWNSTKERFDLFFSFVCEWVSENTVFFGQIRVWTLRWASFPVSQADFQANPEKWEDYDTRYELKISTVWYDHKSDVRLHMPLWPYTFRFSGAHERDTRVLVFPHVQSVHTQPGVEF